MDAEDCAVVGGESAGGGRGVDAMIDQWWSGDRGRSSGADGGSESARRCLGTAGDESVSGCVGGLPVGSRLPLSCGYVVLILPSKVRESLSPMSAEKRGLGGLVMSAGAEPPNPHGAVAAVRAPPSARGFVDLFVGPSA